MKKFIIDKKYWMRGTGLGYLYKSEFSVHDKCCLGFICEQSNIPLEFLDDVRDPSGIALEYSSFVEKIPELVVWRKDACDYNFPVLTTMLANDAVAINDDGSSSDDEKIEKLKELFLQHNIELEFV